MIEFAQLILRSGRAGVELALFVLLPVMIIMLTIMRLLEHMGILARVTRWVSPLLRPLGIPGLGVFAMLQLLFVSFAAPIATLTIMDKGSTSKRHIASTLAMVLAMAQANVVFPMAAVGLNAPMVLVMSLIGGAVAAASTYYLFARSMGTDTSEPHQVSDDVPESHDGGVFAVIQGAGKEALDVCLGAVPMLVLALFVVNVLRSVGAIGFMEHLFTPLLSLFDMSAAAILPIFTKYIAGGTAMMGVMVDLLKAGMMDTDTVNRLAGLLIHPFDMAGVAILITAGKRVAGVIRPAACGAIAGIAVRCALHFIFFR